MSRALARLCLMIAALVMVVFTAAPGASAQDLADLEPADVVEDSAEANADADGDDDVLTTANHTPYNDDHNGLRFVIPDAQPGDGEAAGGTGGGDASAGLALTGTDVEPIIAISAGLLAVGGSALVASRRRLSLFD